jgi:hypothetical protein
MRVFDAKAAICRSNGESATMEQKLGIAPKSTPSSETG